MSDTKVKVNVEDFLVKEKPTEGKITFSGKAIHPSKVVKELSEIGGEKYFAQFANTLFKKLDEMTAVMVDQNKTLIAHGEKIDQQARQIAKMNEAFDFIMSDYFNEVTEGVKSLSEFLSKKIMADGGKSFFKNNAMQESLIARLEVLKGKTDLVEDRTVSFSSEEIQGIYNAIMPDIKRDIEELYKNIVDNLQAMHKGNTKTTANFGQKIYDLLCTTEKNLNEQTHTLLDRLNSSERAIKQSMAGNNRNSYRN